MFDYSFSDTVDSSVECDYNSDDSSQSSKKSKENIGKTINRKDKNKNSNSSTDKNNTKKILASRSSDTEKSKTNKKTTSGTRGINKSKPDEKKIRNDLTDKSKQKKKEVSESNNKRSNIKKKSSISKKKSNDSADESNGSVDESNGSIEKSSNSTDKSNNKRSNNKKKSSVSKKKSNDSADESNDSANESNDSTDESNDSTDKNHDSVNENSNSTDKSGDIIKRGKNVKKSSVSKQDNRTEKKKRSRENSNDSANGRGKGKKIFIDDDKILQPDNMNQKKKEYETINSGANKISDLISLYKNNDFNKTKDVDDDLAYGIYCGNQIIYLKESKYVNISNLFNLFKKKYKNWISLPVTIECDAYIKCKFETEITSIKREGHNIPEMNGIYSHPLLFVRAYEWCSTSESFRTLLMKYLFETNTVILIKDNSVDINSISELHKNQFVDNNKNKMIINNNVVIPHDNDFIEYVDDPLYYKINYREHKFIIDKTNCFVNATKFVADIRILNSWKLSDNYKRATEHIKKYTNIDAFKINNARNPKGTYMHPQLFLLYVTRLPGDEYCITCELFNILFAHHPEYKNVISDTSLLRKNMYVDHIIKEDENENKNVHDKKNNVFIDIVSNKKVIVVNSVENYAFAITQLLCTDYPKCLKQLHLFKEHKSKDVRDKLKLIEKHCDKHNIELVECDE
jgi:hypothetical protein